MREAKSCSSGSSPAPQCKDNLQELASPNSRTLRSHAEGAIFDGDTMNLRLAELLVQLLVILRVPKLRCIQARF